MSQSLLESKFCQLSKMLIRFANTVPFVTILVLGNIAIQLVYHFGTVLEGLIGIFMPNGYLKVHMFMLLSSERSSVANLILSFSGSAAITTRKECSSHCQSLYRFQCGMECHSPYFAMVSALILLLGVHQGAILDQTHLLLPRGHRFVVAQFTLHHLRVEEVHQAHFGDSVINGSRRQRPFNKWSCGSNWKLEWFCKKSIFDSTVNSKIDK